ncbi:MAG: hypothetical protein KBS41_00590 [Oscillospiraceae bacterium]|nr:hypothetical protein [Candidatus Equicaccousia limihippi]
MMEKVKYNHSYENSLCYKLPLSEKIGLKEAAEYIRLIDSVFVGVNKIAYLENWERVNYDGSLSVSSDIAVKEGAAQDLAALQKFAASHGTVLSYSFKAVGDAVTLNKRFQSVMPLIKECKTVCIDRLFTEVEDEISVKTVYAAASHNIDLVTDYLVLSDADEEFAEKIIGKVPFAFYLSQSLISYLKYPASVLCGNKTVGVKMQNLFGESADVKTILQKGKKVEDNLIYEFCTKFLRWRYLNSLERLSCTVTADDTVACFSKGVATSLKNGGTEISGFAAEKGDEVVYPTEWLKSGSAVCYTQKGGAQERNLSKLLGYATSQNVELCEITGEGISPKKRLLALKGGILSFSLDPDDSTAFLITKM